MNSIIPLSSTPASMSSREIAELTEKQHSNVCRDIKNMLDQLYKKDDSKMNHDKIQGVRIEYDDRGYVSVYHLDKTHTYTLIAGYRADIRFKIIQRWQELEAHQRQPTVPAVTPAELHLLMAQTQVEHEKRLTHHDERLNQIDHRQTSRQEQVDRQLNALQQQIVELAKARHRPLAANPYQIDLNFNPLTKPRGEPKGGTHASPREHYRRPHYRTLPDGRQVPVKGHLVNQNKKGETLQ